MALCNEQGKWDEPKLSISLNVVVKWLVNELLPLRSPRYQAKHNSDDYILLKCIMFYLLAFKEETHLYTRRLKEKISSCKIRNN